MMKNYSVSQRGAQRFLVSSTWHTIGDKILEVSAKECKYVTKNHEGKHTFRYITVPERILRHRNALPWSLLFEIFL